VTFVHYSLTPEDLVYGGEVDSLVASRPNVRVVRIYTDAPGAGDLDGFVNVGQLDAIDPSWRSASTYVCGPAPLMSAVTDIFSKAGISEQLNTEAFTLTHWVAEAGSVGGSVRFASGGQVVNGDGRPILELAEAAGLRPASGCRMGICHTCACPLVSGQVRNVVSGEVTSQPGSEVRICVSAAVGDVEIDL
jgi:ferredoxin